MAKSAVSGFAAKLGKQWQETFEEFKDEEINVGSAGECPPIPNGIAQLVDIHLGEYKTGKNQGKPFAYLGAVVISPEYVTDGEGSKLKAAGTQTNQTIPLCETTNSKGETKSAKQNQAEFLNALKKLGLDTKGMSAAAIDAAVVALVQSKPYFVFNVTQSAPSPQYPTPGKFHNWGLHDPNYEDKTDPDAGVVEEAAPATSTKKVATSTKSETNAGSKGMKKTTKKTEEEEVPFGDDLDMTADKADKDYKKAKAWMEERAKELGIAEEDIENADDWQAVAELIRAKESGEEATEEEEETEEAVDYDALGEQADAEGGDADAEAAIRAWGAEYGEEADDHGDKSWSEFVTFIKETYEAEEEEEAAGVVPTKKGEIYQAVVGKNKNPTQVEILVINKAKETVNLKDLENNKVYKDVPFSSLSEVS